MKDTNSGSASRLSQVAAELHKLADGIGSGQVKIGGVDLAISQAITLKIKQKMTGKKVIFDLKIQALLADEETSIPPQPVGTTRNTLKNKRPYGGKVVKKRYGALWRQISLNIKKGECPDSLVVAELQEASSEYGASAPPDWSPLWLEHETLVKQCIGLAQAGDFTGAQHVLLEISLAKKSCHKHYK